MTPEEARSGRWRTVERGGVHYLEKRWGRCVYLDRNNRCTTYQDRPRVCRDYVCDEPGHEDDRIARHLLGR